MGDGLLTGHNEVGLAFGEALAPDTDGWNPVVAGVRDETGEPPPGVMWVMAGFP